MSLRTTLLDLAPTSSPSASPHHLRDRLWRALRAAGWQPVFAQERDLRRHTGTSDHDLLAAFLRGDPTAFEALVDRHAPALLGFAQRSLPHDDAEDAVQDAFVVLLTKGATISAEHNVRGYLFNSTRFAILDRQRKHARTDRLDDHEPPADTDDALTTLLANERTTQLARVLHEACNTLEQEVVLYIKEGQTPEQIATTLGLSPGNLRVIKHRALTKLRRALAPEATS